ncbi:MAG: isocitrate lyase/phosphoenolpyruvate mutase family protein [Pseudomonadota bacterium]
MTAFGDLHRKGDPVVLFNIWDAGSAQAVVKAGAQAVATGSASVAMAHGEADGERLALDLALANAARVVAAVDMPVTVDFEGGYAEAPDEVAANVARLAATGAAGLNFEDGRPGEGSIYPLEAQVERIAAARGADAGLFLNARTDLFLNADAADHAGLVEDALARGAAYAEAGADGVFVPGLTAPDLIARICDGCSLPVNVMWMPGITGRSELAALGVARISHGPFPYLAAMKALEAAAAKALS